MKKLVQYRANALRFYYDLENGLGSYNVINHDFGNSYSNINILKHPSIETSIKEDSTRGDLAYMLLKYIKDYCEET